MLGVGCSSELSTKATNQAPQIVFLEPEEDVVFVEQEDVSLKAEVSDNRDAPEDLRVSWYADGEMICDWENPDTYGQSFCDWTFPAVFFEQQIEFSAVVLDTRQAGASAFRTINVLPKGTPQVQITAPEDGGYFYEGEWVEFEAVVSDSETPLEDLSILWKSNIDDVLESTDVVDEEGFVSTAFQLSHGEQVVSLTVIDLDGRVGNAHKAVRILPPNQPPVCSIVSPSTSSVFGAVVELQAQVSDPDVSVSMLEVTWFSDLDGELGTVTPSSLGMATLPHQGLSLGTHQLSISTVDERGLFCTDEITHLVGEPPVVAFVAPSSGEMFSVGDSISLQVEVYDPDQEPQTLDVVWSSSLDGILGGSSADGSGVASFETNTLSAGQQIVQVTVTDQEGLESTDELSFRINTPPPSPSLEIVPNPATTEDLLTLITTSDPDAEGETITYSYTWYRDEVLSGVTTPAVSSSLTQLGEIWRVEVTPNDGNIDGESVSTMIQISNSAPIILSVSIVPSSNVINESTLQCIGEGEDADGLPQFSYSWINQTTGASIGSGDVLTLSPSFASPKDLIECEVRLEDELGAYDIATSSISVTNRAPQITSVETSELEATTSALLGCTETALDPDGDSLSSSYLWSFVGGGLIGNSPNLQLDPTLVVPGDQIRCTATVSDPHGGTDTLSSDVVTVVNSPPVIHSILVSPEVGVVNTGTLTCLISSSDVDGPAPVASYKWTNLSTGLEIGFSPSLTLDPSIASSGDVIECLAVVADSDGAMADASDQVVVKNGVPLIDGIAIDPSTGIHSETQLICSASATDPDGTTLTPIYRWTNASTGTELGEGDTIELTNELASPDDLIICTAEATDADGGEDFSSAAVLVENRLPAIDELTMTVSDAQGNEIPLPQLVNVLSFFSGQASASDPDGDEVQIRYTWFVNGAAQPGGSSELNVDLDKYDMISLMVTPFDGREEGASASTSEVIIYNSEPTAPEVELLPSHPVEGDDDLLCAIRERGEDVDPNDLVSYNFTWTYLEEGGVQANTYTGLLNSTYFPGDTVPASEISAWETWQCKATSFDGEEEGGFDVSENVEVQARCDPTDGPKLYFLGLEFSCVWSDIFMMGSQSIEVGRPTGSLANEDLHGVGLTEEFFISTTEITQSLYEQVMFYNPSQYSNCGGDCPVERVSWHEAAAFTNRMSQMEGLQECYECAGIDAVLDASDEDREDLARDIVCSHLEDPYLCEGYRLPTEAEWEMVARAGSSSAFWTPSGGAEISEDTLPTSELMCNISIPFELSDGTILGEYAWHCSNNPQATSGQYVPATSPVGLKEPNGYGMFDMHGNIREWTHDLYVSALGNSPILDPVGTEDSLGVTLNVNTIKGGFYYDEPQDLRCAARDYSATGTRIANLGFRIARTFPPLE